MKPRAIVAARPPQAMARTTTSPTTRRVTSGVVPYATADSAPGNSKPTFLDSENNAVIVERDDSSMNATDGADFMSDLE